MFTGLSAFPLTPFAGDRLDTEQLRHNIALLARSGVDSIGALGSTGSYAYLHRNERQQTARAAVEAADGVPVIIGVGAIATRDVLDNVEDAISAGAAGVLLAPMTYQPLTDEEVFGLYAEVDARFDMPLVVYDNPATTGVTISDELHGRIAQLPQVASIKIPAVKPDAAEARRRVDRLRAQIPADVTIGISGDAVGARGLLAGCDAWYSVLAGIFPRTCAEIAHAAAAGNTERATTLSAELDPIWSLFARFGSYRVASAIAVETGLLLEDSTRLPVRPLRGPDRAQVKDALRTIGERQ